MLNVLIKDCQDNIYLVKGGMKDKLLAYKKSIGKDSFSLRKINQIIKAIEEHEEEWGILWVNKIS